MRAFAMLIFLDGGGCFPVQSVAALKDLNYPMVVVVEVVDHMAVVELIAATSTKVCLKAEGMPRQLRKRASKSVMPR
jgi:hypothetical protein